MLSRSSLNFTSCCSSSRRFNNIMNPTRITTTLAQSQRRLYTLSSSLMISSRRFQSTTSNNNNNNNNNNDDFIAAVGQRLDVLENVVTNLVTNMTEYQQQMQANMSNMPPPSAPSQQNQEAGNAAGAGSSTNQSSSSSVVAPSTMRSVVKVYSTIVAPNSVNPWQTKNLTTATGTAFMVDRKRKMLMTNAHVVAYASLIEVRRHGQARRCVAECKFISGDCDLALLEVQDDTFWEELSSTTADSNNNCVNNVNPPDFFSGVYFENNTSETIPPSLEAISKIDVFEGFPSLQQNVQVTGFPLGGDQISITSGVVSRIDQTPYSTSGLRIAAIQIDAAINPGNSGGPALCDGKVVGVAFQSLIQAEGIGYIIPNCVVAHFVRSYLTLNNNNNNNSENKNSNSNSNTTSSTTTSTTSSEISTSSSSPNQNQPQQQHQGLYHEGFPSVGLYYQELGNPTLREHFGLPTEANGFLVEKLVGGSPNSDKLKAGDIIMKVDGRQIERDITIEWRPNERIQFTHLIHMRNPGSVMTFTVWRDKKEIDIDVIVKVPQPLVRPHLLHPSLASKPPYVMFSGCVFTILSVPYLESWGANWPTTGPRALVNMFLYGEISDEQNEVVVLCQILPHAVNRGYSSDSFAHRCVTKVGGEKVKNFKHFVKLLNKAANNEKEKHVHLGLSDAAYPLTMVLPREDSREADSFLTQSHGIPSNSAILQK